MADEERARRNRLLREQHGGISGDPTDRWRAAVEDLEEIPFGGVGFWRQIAPPEIDVARGQLFRGTGPNAGEVRDIAIDLTGGTAPTICLATNGGVWKSDDGGERWQSISDALPTSTIGAVGIDPGTENIIYAGSRNLVDGGGIVPRALGAFRTNDGGKTWASLDGGPDATVMSRGVNRIICPAPNVVLMGCPNGLFLSVDGGATFGANAPDFNDLKPVLEGSITGLEIDTAFRVARKIESTRGPGGPGSPVEVKVFDHGFVTGEVVSVGKTEDENARGVFVVRELGAHFFELTNSEAGSTDSTHGVVLGPNHPRPLSVAGVLGPTPAGPLVVTVSAHGLISGDIVVVSGVTALAAANGSWRVKVLSVDTFELVGSAGSGMVGAGGTVLAPQRPTPVSIVSADNTTTGIELRVPGHAFRNGDRVALAGVPGVDAISTGTVSVSTAQPDTIIVSGLKRSAGALVGPLVVGPATAWNMAYVAVAGRQADGKTRADTRGLYRLTLAGSGATRTLAISKNLLTGGTIPANYNVVRFAQGTTRPSTLYVALQDTTPSTRFLTLLRSEDYGDTWKRALIEMPTGLTKDGTDGSDDAFTLGVDPQDDGRVYLGLRQLWRSVDAGAMFPQMQLATEGGDMHADLGTVGLATSASLLPRDHFALAFLPPTFWPDVTPPITPLYCGTSGGIARSDTGGGAFVHLNHGLQTADLLAVGMSEEKTEATYVGGLHIGIAGQLKRAGVPLSQGILGDASHIAVDPLDPKIVYAFVDGRFVRTVNGGEDWQTNVAPARPIVTAVEHPVGDGAILVKTLGHSFVDNDAITVSDVRVAGAPFNKVNGARKIRIATDDTFIIDLSIVDVEAFPAFDGPAQATGKRFVDAIGIVKVTGDASIKIETAVPHGHFAPIEVHIEGVLGIPEANNTAAHFSWMATPDSERVLSIPVASASTESVQQDRARLRFLADADTVPIQFATFHDQDPIVVTGLNHGFVSGASVSIAGVRGNTNANVTNQAITVIDRNSFRLDGVAGNAAWGAQPSVEGKPLARKLPASTRLERQCISLLPHRDPQTHELISGSHTIFASVRRELYQSDDDGHSFTLLRTFDSDVTALLTPKENMIWVGLASGQVHSGLGPGVWRGPGRDTYEINVGARGPITSIAIEPGNDKHVVVTAAGHTGLHRNRGTHHVFETGTAGLKESSDSAAWAEIHGPALLSPGTTPDLPAMSAAFAKVTLGSELFIATDGGVIRPIGTAAPWRRVGPNMPNVSCQGLIITTPVAAGGTLRLATAGRGLWELVRPTQPTLMLRASLGFGDRALNSSSVLKVSAVNVGNGEAAVINAESNRTEFFVDLFPIIRRLTEGLHTEFDVTFKPTALGTVEGTITVHWAPAGEPTRDITIDVSGMGVPPGLPRVSVRSRVLRFGRVTIGPDNDVEIPIVIRNTGTADADITSIALTPSGAPFTLDLGTITGPLPALLKANESATIKVKFGARSTGAKSTKLEIKSQPVSGGLAQPPRTITIDVSGEGTTQAGVFLYPVLASLGLADQSEEVTT